MFILSSHGVKSCFLNTCSTKLIFKNIFFIIAVCLASTTFIGKLYANEVTQSKNIKNFSCKELSPLFRAVVNDSIDNSALIEKLNIVGIKNLLEVTEKDISSLSSKYGECLRTSDTGGINFDVKDFTSKYTVKVKNEQLKQQQKEGFQTWVNDSEAQILSFEQALLDNKYTIEEAENILSNLYRIVGEGEEKYIHRENSGDYTIIRKLLDQLATQAEFLKEVQTLAAFNDSYNNLSTEFENILTHESQLWQIVQLEELYTKVRDTERALRNFSLGDKYKNVADTKKLKEAKQLRFFSELQKSINETTSALCIEETNVLKSVLYSQALSDFPVEYRGYYIIPNRTTIDDLVYGTIQSGYFDSFETPGLFSDNIALHLKNGVSFYFHQGQFNENGYPVGENYQEGFAYDTLMIDYITDGQNEIHSSEFDLATLQVFYMQFYQPIRVEECR